MSQTSVDFATLVLINALDILNARQCSTCKHSIEVLVTILYKGLLGFSYRAQHACTSPLT